MLALLFVTEVARPFVLPACCAELSMQSAWRRKATGGWTVE